MIILTLIQELADWSSVSNMRIQPIVRRARIKTSALLLIMGLLLFTTSPSMGQLFNDPVTYTTCESPYSVAAGDFDEDGHIDLAVANADCDSVSILFGIGDGTFASVLNLSTGEHPQSVITGDCNEDGHLDIIVANNYADNVSIILGFGDGTFGPPAYLTTGYNPTSVKKGDFNGDGHLDLTVTNTGFISYDRIAIFLGSGDGTFASAGYYTVIRNPFTVTVDDFNEDGYLDLATANGTTYNVAIFLGRGDGTFASAVYYPTGSGPWGIASGDFNNDGHIDLATANQHSDNVSIMLGFGDGTFAAPVNFAAGDVPSEVTCGDFNEDGQIDLAVANRSSSNVSILIGAGDGTFASADNYVSGIIPFSITTGDFDEDGHTDLAVANSGSDNISILINLIGAEPVAVALDLDPETINLKSKGKWVTAYIEMPEYYNVEEIDRSSLRITIIDGDSLSEPICAAAKPTAIGDYDEDGVTDLMVKFDRQELQDRLIYEEGIREITIDGVLDDGTEIRGADLIKVIHSPFEQLAVTRFEIKWDDVTTPDRPHLDAFSVHGSAVLSKQMPVNGLSWNVHFLLSLAGNAAVFEETVGLAEHCSASLFVYTKPDMSGTSFIERLVICDPMKWRDGMEIPAGLLDNDGTRFVRDILYEVSGLSGRLFVYIRGTMDLPKDWERKVSSRDACIVLETFTKDHGSLANLVLIDEAELKVSTAGGSNVWKFGGKKEAEIDVRPEPVDSGEETPEGAEPMEDTPVSYRLALFQNHPNPFNPATTITYELAEPAYVCLQIFNVRGRLIRTLVNGSKGLGSHEAVWDGLNEDRSVAVSGIYFYRLVAGDFVQTKKMVLLR